MSKGGRFTQICEAVGAPPSKKYLRSLGARDLCLHALVEDMFDGNGAQDS